MHSIRKLFAAALVSAVLFGGFRVIYSLGTPAGTEIRSGGDRGQPGVEDIPGDTILSFSGGIVPYVTSNEVKVWVSTGFAAGPVEEPPGTLHGRIGRTEYFPVVFANQGNAIDLFSVTVSTVTGPGWDVTLISDSNLDGMHQPDELAVLPLLEPLAPDASFYFFVGVRIATGTVIGSSVTVRVEVRDGSGTGFEDNWYSETGNDVRLTTFTVIAIPPDDTPPAVPVGLSVVVSSGSGSVLLSWSQNRPEDNILGYLVYRAASIGDLVALDTYSYTSFVTTSSFTDTYFGSVPVYYKVRSVNSWWDISEDSMYIDSLPDGNLVSVFLDPDRTLKAELLVPKAAAAGLFSSGNSSGEDLHISIDRLKAEEAAGDIGVYELTIMPGGRARGAAKHISFGSNRVELRIFYTDPELTAKGVSNPSNRLAIFYDNGVAWENIGGLHVPGAKYFYIKTNHLSRYKLALASMSSDMGLISIVPHKIFAPKDPGPFSKVKFTLRYPVRYSPAGKIFDLTGMPVRDLSASNLQFDSEVAVAEYEWDGRDKTGAFVSAGIYIYQFDYGTKVVNGTVVVAR